MTQPPAGRLPPAPPVVPPPPPAPRPPAAPGSRLQRWRLPVALAVGLLVLTGAIGWAVLASAHRSSSSAIPATAGPTPAATAAPATPGSTSSTKAPRVRGTITAETEASWTLTTASGKTVAVSIGKGTKFGTKQAPAQRAQLPVGTVVVVTGTEKDGVIQAERIAAATPAPASTTTPTR